MKNSKYSVVVIIRVILICLNCFVLIWLIKNTGRIATTLFALMVLVLQTTGLIYYNNRIQRDLANFLIFLLENDTSLAFSKEKIERNFKGLVASLDKINQNLRDARLDRERQYHYLQAIVKQVDTGIIACDQDGTIEIFNRAARDLLGLRSLRTIRELVDSRPELAVFLTAGKTASVSPLKVETSQNEYALAVKTSSIRFDNRIIQLIILQNIKPELDAGELDAWRKLIRIQRHEIINSITPITTLTTAIKRSFIKNRTRKALKEITSEHIGDALKSVDVIEDRSRGLIDFVERFRSLTDVPSLKRISFPLSKLMDHIAVLFSKDLNARNVMLKIVIEPENLMLTADERLLEQVMINLVKNSLEALHDPGGEIIVRANSDLQHNIIIQVIDNGIGIESTALGSVFVPSYTTKENGSGIGLSITRQIIHMHRGTIGVKSVPGKETIFKIVLPIPASPPPHFQHA